MGETGRDMLGCERVALSSSCLVALDFLAFSFALTYSFPAFSFTAKLHILLRSFLEGCFH